MAKEKKFNTEGRTSAKHAAAMPEIRKYQQEMAALDRDLRENPPGRPRRPRR